MKGHVLKKFNGIVTYINNLNCNLITYVNILYGNLLNQPNLREATIPGCSLE